MDQIEYFTQVSSTPNSVWLNWSAPAKPGKCDILYYNLSVTYISCENETEEWVIYGGNIFRCGEQFRVQFFSQFRTNAMLGILSSGESRNSLMSFLFVDITEMNYEIPNLPEENWNYTVYIQAFTRYNGDGTRSTQSTIATTDEGGTYD